MRASTPDGWGKGKSPVTISLSRVDADRKLSGSDLDRRGQSVLTQSQTGAALPCIAASQARAGRRAERRLDGAYLVYALRPQPTPTAAEWPLAKQGQV